MQNEPIVFVVDDDENARESACMLVRSMGLPTESFPSAEAFLKDFDPSKRGCLVTDLRMLGMSGIELLEELARRNSTLPVIVLTAYARTSLTVRAMQAGAVTMLDKPYSEDELWDQIRRALHIGADRESKREQQEKIQVRLDRLSESEREIMKLIVAGKPNKAIARSLDVSMRTIEYRRQAVYKKMEVASLAELVQLVVAADDSQPLDK